MWENCINNNIKFDNVIYAGRARQRRWFVFQPQQLQIAGQVEKLFHLIFGLGESTVRNPLKVLLIQGE
jgi:hypothetical protein